MIRWEEIEQDTAHLYRYMGSQIFTAALERINGLEAEIEWLNMMIDASDKARKAADAEITPLKEELLTVSSGYLRMFVLAIKHCPQDHRDFEEIKAIIKAINDNK